MPLCTGLLKWCAMASDIYLTIDDSPSYNTDILCDYFAANDIPALLFCRGDLMDRDAAPLVRAIEKGAVIASHNYSHTPAGDLSYEEIIGEIEKTEALIDAAYRAAGKAREGKYFRFPYIDRGNGDRLERRFGQIIENPSQKLPSDEKVQQVQDYLQTEGFTQPFANMRHPLYQNDDVAGAADCLFTYSSCDWMLTGRHVGKWDYKTLDDLKRKIDDDHWLCTGEGPQIALFHDQPELENIVPSLLDHLKAKGCTFLPFS